MPRKFTRRGLVAGALAAAPVMAQTPWPAGGEDPARANLSANMEAIRKIPLDISVQPAFVFKP